MTAARRLLKRRHCTTIPRTLDPLLLKLPANRSPSMGALGHVSILGPLPITASGASA